MSGVEGTDGAGRKHEPPMMVNEVAIGTVSTTAAQAVESVTLATSTFPVVLIVGLFR